MEQGSPDPGISVGWHLLLHTFPSGRQDLFLHSQIPTPFSSSLLRDTWPRFSLSPELPTPQGMHGDPSGGSLGEKRLSCVWKRWLGDFPWPDPALVSLCQPQLTGMNTPEHDIPGMSSCRDRLSSVCVSFHYILGLNLPWDQ